ncbi:MAG: 1-deoxy-D-xylulose-5-phosphate synthase [Firmicutes bacterium]|nr:1-deoxy-D-xylulose-5-phosphate synthase [Bacillota bacterium]
MLKINIQLFAHKKGMGSTKMRTRKEYLELKKAFKKTFRGTAPRVYSGIESLKDNLRNIVVPGGIFEQLGFKYFGPVDGHNIEDLIDVLRVSQLFDSPVVIHVVTKKGKGYVNAEKNPDKFHSIAPFEPTTGKPLAPVKSMTYSGIFGEKLTEMAERDPRVIAVSAAMISGTGLDIFENHFPERVYDAGIAEQHAVDLAAGLALGGQRPVVAIYSTFLQRAYDQILMDVCLQNLPVVFAIDRAGNVGNDGPTHHGLFDLSYLSHMPNMTVMVPSDGTELQAMLDFSITLDGPSAIRYPKGKVPPMTKEIREPLQLGKARKVADGKDVTIFAAGPMLEYAKAACMELEKEGITVDLFDARFAAPIDKEAILDSAKKTGRVVTIEDNVIPGGFGMAVTAVLTDHLPEARILRLGWEGQFLEQGGREQLFALHGLDGEGIKERVKKFLEGTA